MTKLLFMNFCKTRKTDLFVITIMLFLGIIWFYIINIHEKSITNTNQNYIEQVSQISNITNNTNQILMNIDQKVSDILNRQIIIYNTVDNLVNKRPIPLEFNDSLKLLNGQN